MRRIRGIAAVAMSASCSWHSKREAKPAASPVLDRRSQPATPTLDLRPSAGTRPGFAQHVGAADDAIYLKDSKNVPLRTPAATKGKTAGIGVSGFVPKWRDARDSDENYVYAIALQND